MRNALILLLLLLGTAYAKESSTSVSQPATAPKPASVQKTTVPQHYTVPRVAKTDTPLRARQPKSCQEYLAICERSCQDRGTMFKFQCIGKDFQPFQNHFRCQCADDLNQGSTPSIQVKVEQ